jgi:hypothetical protein
VAKPTGLVGELRTQLKALEDDLRFRVDGSDVDGRQPGVYEQWRAQWESALQAKRTTSSWQAWRDERVMQAAAAWVLLTVFARFCEDNELVRPVWIAGHTKERRQLALDARRVYFQENPENNDRHWLGRIAEHFKSTGATAGLVDAYSPMHLVAPSGDAATRLLQFWWETDAGGELLRQFRNPELGTRFLGDLYQDLSEFAQDKYALLQTPEFVEEFILDQTMEPALAERPLDGFRLIDPTCGSGHFMLGAFRRLLDRWSKHAPNLEPRTLVQKALDGVHGVDINPFAVATARFRLIVAALKATGELSLENAPDFHVNLAAGDSLLFGARQRGLGDDLFTIDESVFAYSTEDRKALERLLQTRDGKPALYDVVVGNPPYISVEDKALNATYRRLYHYCKGTYALTVPFMELFFQLGKGGERPGWIGQGTSNSFMKREFGKPLIEDFLARKDLRAVIDTSGAYIPGHGTPTVILVGRNQARVDDTVRAVLGVRGEPGRPDLAAKGLVWSSIVDHINDPDFENEWISVTNLDRQILSDHPWSLSGGGLVELSTALDKRTNVVLRDFLVRIGFFGDSHADEAYFVPNHFCKRLRIQNEYARASARGDDIRDWDAPGDEVAIFPYNHQHDLVELSTIGSAGNRYLWSLRTVLGSRSTFSGGTYFSDRRPWYEWHQLPKDAKASRLSSAFAEVATHNHFVLDRGGKVFNRTAPVIKLPERASEDDHIKLLGVLNSSIACFWLKQNSFDKGNGGIGGGIGDEAWERRYQFGATKVQNFPLSAKLPLDRSRILDSLAQKLTQHSPQAVTERATPTRGTLDAAWAEHDRILALMIAHQEELDWECYRLYGLISEDLTYQRDLPGIQLGERAFEIVLARALENGEHTEWFTRHGSTPITEIPAHWPTDYQALVQRRLDVIAGNKNIHLLEKPEYKRRWSIEAWDKRVRSALKDWLLDRLEDRKYWFDREDRPRPRAVVQLADEVDRDADFRAVLQLWSGQLDASTTTVLQDLLADQAVPYLAAYRYKPSGLDKRTAWEHTWDLQRKEDAGELPLDPKTGQPKDPIPVPPKYKQADFAKPAYWSHRGKLDVPKERFILYPGANRETDSSQLLGWAGWNHAQQALSLATIMNEREAEGWDDERMVPLIAGLAELQPWVRQWHSDVDPTYGVSLAAIIDEELTARAQRAGKTHDEVAAWRPASSGRGKRRSSKRGDA